MTTASRALRAMLIALLTVFAGGCTTSAVKSGPTTAASTPGERPDATFAVNARTAIDAVDALRIEVLQWAGTAAARGTITAERAEQVITAAELVESAVTVANAQLASYLVDGSLSAAQALRDALTELAEHQQLLQRTRKGES